MSMHSNSHLFQQQRAGVLQVTSKDQYKLNPSIYMFIYKMLIKNHMKYTLKYCNRHSLVTELLNFHRLVKSVTSTGRLFHK